MDFRQLSRLNVSLVSHKYISILKSNYKQTSISKSQLFKRFTKKVNYHFSFSTPQSKFLPVTTTKQHKIEVIAKIVAMPYLKIDFVNLLQKMPLSLSAQFLLYEVQKYNTTGAKYSKFLCL